MGHEIELDEGRLLERVGSLSTGRANALGIDMGEATKEFMRFASCYDRGNADIERKVLHSLRVAALCNDVAEDDGKVDLGAVTLAGLLHDVGRFPQYAMHGSYSDAATGCDHGELSHVLLAEFGLLARFVDGGSLRDPRAHADMMLRAIRLHNKLRLPERMGAAERAYATHLRDADIIDILDISASPFGMPHDPREISEAASEAVMGFVRRRETVDRTQMRNDTDVVISRLALAFAVEGDRAREILRGHAGWEGYLARREISGEAAASVEETLGFLGV